MSDIVDNSMRDDQSLVQRMAPNRERPKTPHYVFIGTVISIGILASVLCINYLFKYVNKPQNELYIRSSLRPTNVATFPPAPNPLVAPSATPLPSQTLLDQEIELASGGVRDFIIEVPTASHFGVSLIAPVFVESALISPSGVLSASIKANSPEANEPFEELVVENPMTGTWTLRLTNRGKTAADIFISAGVIRK